MSSLVWNGIAHDHSTGVGWLCWVQHRGAVMNKTFQIQRSLKVNKVWPGWRNRCRWSSGNHIGRHCKRVMTVLDRLSRRQTQWFDADRYLRSVFPKGSWLKCQKKVSSTPHPRHGQIESLKKGSILFYFFLQPVAFSVLWGIVKKCGHPENLYSNPTLFVILSFNNIWTNQAPIQSTVKTTEIKCTWVISSHLEGGEALCPCKRGAGS